jgi:hypothetical protein
MPGKDKKVSYHFSDDYRELPPKMRVRLNMTANKLLELQKENSAYLTNVEDPSLDDDREDGKTDIR